VFLEEEDYWRERRVTDSGAGFRELSGGREDEGNKGNPREIRKVLLSLSGGRVRRGRFRSRFQ